MMANFVLLKNRSIDPFTLCIPIVIHIILNSYSAGVDEQVRIPSNKTACARSNLNAREFTLVVATGLVQSAKIYRWGTIGRKQKKILENPRDSITLPISFFPFFSNAFSIDSVSLFGSPRHHWAMQFIGPLAIANPCEF